MWLRGALGSLGSHQETDGDGEDDVRDLVDVTLRYMDRDKDGHVSLEDYLDTCRYNPLWTDMLAPCLLTSTREGVAFMKKMLDQLPQNRIYQE